MILLDLNGYLPQLVRPACLFIFNQHYDKAVFERLQSSSTFCSLTRCSVNKLSVLFPLEIRGTERQ